MKAGDRIPAKEIACAVCKDILLPDNPCRICKYWAVRQRLRNNTSWRKLITRPFFQCYASLKM
ncbi:MAG: hypothetical protein LBQ89_00315 [Treponema sp.]|nr:hypothetical protein [Treponema sp.]